jgi:hypothetical protein
MTDVDAAYLSELASIEGEMPIVETQPKQAFEKFETHMSNLVNSVLTLPGGTSLTIKWKDEAGNLAFTRGGVPTLVPLASPRFGTLYLSVSQDLIALREGRKFRLRTKRYAYKLFGTDDPRADALLRWEFSSETDDGKECRNHLHVNTTFPVGHGTFNLNRLHVPSAWVLVEHVLRFVFHDLQVPAKTQEWPARLRASETEFYENFTGKRYRWSGQKGH